jgi:hypothetical protein
MVLEKENRMRYFIAVAVAAQAFCCVALATDPAEQLAARKAAIQKELADRPFEFIEDPSGVLGALGKSSGDVLIHIVYRPKNRCRLTFKFERDGKEVLAVEGHTASSFFARNNALYFAHIPLGTAGCTVASYDLKTAETLWETKLDPVNPRAHSVYSNQVQIGWRDDEAIEVIGHESLGDYIAILDTSTGEVLAKKLYR